MHLALPVFRSRISPVFDFSTRALIVELDQGKEMGRQELDIADMPPQTRIEMLKKAGVDILICAGLSELFHNMLIMAGVKVIPGIVGEVDDVIRAYQIGDLKQKRFMMPGCCKRRWGRRHRGGRRCQ